MKVERGMKRWSGPTRGPTKGGAGNPSLGVEEEVRASSVYRGPPCIYIRARNIYI